MDESEVDPPDAWLKRSEERLTEAEFAFKGGYWRSAVSSAYYSMFYTARAALLTVGVDSHKHRAIGGLLSQHFIKNGLLDRRYNVMLAKAMQSRDISDYEVTEPIVQSDAEDALANAREFITAVRALIH